MGRVTTTLRQWCRVCQRLTGNRVCEACGHWVCDGCEDHGVKVCDGDDE